MAVIDLLAARRVMHDLLADVSLPAGVALRVPGLLSGEQRAVAERAVREYREHQQEMARRVKLAKACAKLIVARLTQLGLCYRREGVNNARLQQVKFRRIDVGHEAAFLWVDTRRIPRGVTLTGLGDEGVLRELSFACQREVTAESEDLEAGFAYVIEFKSGYRRIPRVVEYSDMLKAMPADAPPLAVPIGVGENYLYEFGDIERMPHLLVGGATMQGKSNEINAMLCTLIQRNRPEDLGLILIDLKGGMEFSFYEGIPHLLKAIVTRREDVVPTLEEVYREIERRMALFKGVTRSLRGWNSRRKKGRLAYWVLVVDELMNIMLDPKLKAPAERLLADIAARARAVGVHSILCTQRPQVEVVSGLIKGNYPTRIAFACADDASSRVILDNNEAARLGHVGRLIYYFGSRRREFQAPLVTDAMTREIVSGVKAGRDTLEVRKRHDITAEDMMRWAIEHLGGRFPVDDVYDEFRPRGVRREDVIVVGREYEGQEVEIDGLAYVLRPSPGGVTPRILEPVTANDEPDLEASEIEQTAPAAGVTAEDMMRWAVENLDGKFPIRSIYEQFRSSGVKKADVINIAKEYEGRAIDVKGQRYILLPSPGRLQSRILVPAPVGPVLPNIDAQESVESGTNEVYESISSELAFGVPSFGESLESETPTS